MRSEKNKIKKERRKMKKKNGVKSTRTEIELRKCSVENFITRRKMEY